MHMRISRKEANESAYWIKLIMECNSFENNTEASKLHQEAIELKMILS